MIYKCVKCNGIFNRAGIVFDCPYCGHESIITSTEEEANEIVKRLNKTKEDEKGIIEK